MAIAGAGAVLGGLAGYWNAYQTTRGLAQAPLLSIVGKGDAGPLSIVVLPFSNLTGDPTQDYLADGLTVAIAADLSRIRDAFVVSTATAFGYKGRSTSLPQIQRELGVRFALQGGVQRSADKLLISAQLADTTNNRQLWAESFEGSQADLFALQDLVTARIGNSIGRETLTIVSRESESRKGNPNAVDLVLRARAIGTGSSMTVATLTEAVALYRQALTLDTKNVQAMIGLALTLATIADNGYSLSSVERKQQLSEAYTLAHSVKERSPSDPGPYSVFAAYASANGDFEGARRANETALALDPRTPYRYSNLADDYLDAGQPEPAIDLLDKAIRLDPKRPNWTILVNMGRAQFMLGDTAASIQWLLKSIDFNPTLTAYGYLSAAYILQGDVARAKAAAATVLRMNPKFRLTDFETPIDGYPSEYREFWQNRLLPACRQSGLPD